jgi:LacI family transcriptional regulator
MATIADIAKAAGVSDMTVSRVLNGNADYRRPTFRKRAERIRALADSLGYRPNAAARAARTGQFNAVTLLLSSNNRRSKLPEHMLEGIHDALEEQDLSLNLVRLPDEQLIDDGIVPRLLRERSSDGLLIDYIYDIPPRMIELIERHDVPAVWYNVDRDTNAVCPDDLQAGRLATELLLQAGHRRITYVSHNLTDETPHYSVLDRLRGYEQAMRDAGLTPRASTHRPGKFTFHDMFINWLREPDRPTAVVAYSPSMVAGVLLASTEVGLRFPDDLSLITFASEPYGLLRPLDTLLVPLHRVGRAGVEMLTGRVLAGLSMPTQRFPFTHHRGDSIRPPAL